MLTAEGEAREVIYERERRLNAELAEAEAALASVSAAQSVEEVGALLLRRDALRVLALAATRERKEENARDYARQLAQQSAAVAAQAAREREAKERRAALLWLVKADEEIGLLSGGHSFPASRAGKLLHLMKANGEQEAAEAIEALRGWDKITPACVEHLRGKIASVRGRWNISDAEITAEVARVKKERIDIAPLIARGVAPKAAEIRVGLADS